MDPAKQDVMSEGQTGRVYADPSRHRFDACKNSEERWREGASERLIPLVSSHPTLLVYGLRNLIPCSFVPVFDQFRVVLKKRSVEQHSPEIDEPAYPEQLLEIGKPTLQDEYLVLDVGAAFLQQPCLGVYLIERSE